MAAALALVFTSSAHSAAAGGWGEGSKSPKWEPQSLSFSRVARAVLTDARGQQHLPVRAGCCAVGSCARLGPFFGEQRVLVWRKSRAGPVARGGG